MEFPFQRERETANTLREHVSGEKNVGKDK